MADVAANEVITGSNAMRIYIFSSEPNKELRAFAGDAGGGELPEKFRPWHGVGVIRDDQNPPHNLPRHEIERAIEAHGFQLWRLKSQAG